MDNEQTSQLQQELDACREELAFQRERNRALETQLTVLRREKEQLSQQARKWRSLSGKYQEEARIHLHSRRYRLGDTLFRCAKNPLRLFRLPYDLFMLGVSMRRARRERLQPAAQTPSPAPAAKAPAPASPPPAPILPPKYSREDILSISRSRLDRSELPQRPLVSLIVVTHNGLHNLKTLFASLRACRFYENYEIVCVDNASSDDSIAFLREQQAHFSLTLIQNSKNESFSRANNQGAQAAKGEYLLFLNNDIEVTDGWLDEMLRAALRDERAGAVGAKLVYPLIPDSALNRGKSYRIQHGGVGFSRDSFEGQPFIRPMNLLNGEDAFTDGEEKTRRIAAVTAACLLMKRSVFEEIGGYDEGYVYGYEDVDLCLKAHRRGYHNYYCPSATLFHYEFGTQQQSAAEQIVRRRTANIRLFSSRWGEYLRRRMLEDKLAGTSLFSPEPLCVAFAVTEAYDGASAGDYFTAMELAQALQKRGCRVRYLCRRGGEDWYDVGEDVDVLVSMLDCYDLSRVRNASPELVSIAWARNWFERWCQNPSIQRYTHLLASSPAACREMQALTGRSVTLFPIAANAERFSPDAPLPAPQDDRYESDYVFTGSYWHEARAICDTIRPGALPYRFRVYGKNWEDVEEFAPYCGGFVRYEDMPQVYRHTKIVVDDANRVTVRCGAVNSRVFDALAAGRLVLTNGALGAEETFGGALPVFSNRQEFEALLRHYMENEDARREKVRVLREYVLAHHTYDIRAGALLDLLRKTLLPYENRIAILAPVPRMEEAEQWGDYHFALALKKCFERRGLQADVRILPQWREPIDAHAVLVLRGLSEYAPRMEHVNLMWNISHPDKITHEEYEAYDAVFAASLPYARKLAGELRVPVFPLLQCADPELFFPEEGVPQAHELLFVGNSRKVFRRAVRGAMGSGYDLSVYGTNWEPLIDARFIRGQNIPNRELSRVYQSCAILLNDHWDDMREKGFISNRIFDALCCGAFILSDDVAGLDELLPGAVAVYRTQEELRGQIERYMRDPQARRRMAQAGCELVRREHTFQSRADKMLSFITSRPL